MTANNVVTFFNTGDDNGVKATVTGDGHDDHRNRPADAHAGKVRGLRNGGGRSTAAVGLKSRPPPRPWICAQVWHSCSCLRAPAKSIWSSAAEPRLTS